VPAIVTYGPSRASEQWEHSRSARTLQDTSCTMEKRREGGDEPPEQREASRLGLYTNQRCEFTKTIYPSFPLTTGSD
jgi:hypothetical protein